MKASLIKEKWRGWSTSRKMLINPPSMSFIQNIYAGYDTEYQASESESESELTTNDSDIDSSSLELESCKS
jgi:hypothetical protein